MIVLNAAALSVLGAIAVLHLIWAVRIWWPIPNERDLVRAVAGFPGADRMPPALACLAVTVAVLIATIPLILTLFSAEVTGPAWLVTLGASMVFLARGLVGFTAFWARMTPEQPFRRLDRRIYSPVITALGVVFLLNLV
jgi:amino acid transporter